MEEREPAFSREQSKILPTTVYNDRSGTLNQTSTALMYRLVDREIPDMFGRRRKVGVDDEGGRFIAKLLSHEFETERMKEAARSSQRSVAILKPQIPIGVGQSIGWFGGNAALPLGMAWPEQDGQKLLFVGQINLSALPQDLWSGVGPRVGWLGIFLPAHWPPNPTIIHFDGPLAEAMLRHQTALIGRASTTSRNQGRLHFQNGR